MTTGHRGKAAGFQPLALAMGSVGTRRQGWETMVGLGGVYPQDFPVADAKQDPGCNDELMEDVLFLFPTEHAFLRPGSQRTGFVISFPFPRPPSKAERLKHTQTDGKTKGNTQLSQDRYPAG